MLQLPIVEQTGFEFAFSQTQAQASGQESAGNANTQQIWTAPNQPGYQPAYIGQGGAGPWSLRGDSVEATLVVSGALLIH